MLYRRSIRAKFPYTYTLHRILFFTLTMMVIPVAMHGCQTSAGDVEPHHQIAPAATLPQDIETKLCEVGWRERVGDRLGIWVSVERQQLIGIKGRRVKFVYPCSTGEKGTGNQENSYKTPLGWHAIDERIGDGMPKGAVFVSREYQNYNWTPENDTEKDLVLTRIMWLRGLERGINRGPGIDSHDRYIYIHGTPEEDKIGTPASHGCVRLKNDDVIKVFDSTRSGTRVLITEW